MADGNSTPKGCVYQAKCVATGKSYVGKTISGLVIRKRRHFNDAAKGARYPFARALKKYGREAFAWSVLYRSNDNQVLIDKEKECIALLQTKVPLGYNITEGGEGTTGRVCSSETRAKMSRSNRGRQVTAEQREQLRLANLGKKATPETKAKMSRVRKGRPISEQHRLNISRGKKGRPRSKPRFSEKKSVWTKEHNKRLWARPEYRATMLAANTGRPMPPHVREKLLAVNLGRKASPETRQKMSESRRGKKRSPEAVAKGVATRMNNRRKTNANTIQRMATEDQGPLRQRELGDVCPQRISARSPQGAKDRQQVFLFTG